MHAGNRWLQVITIHFFNRKNVFMKEKLNKKEQYNLYTLFTIFTSDIVG